MAATDRATRIVATIGPASGEPRILRKLIAAGLDVARLNMSHGEQGTHARTIGLLRRESERARRPVGIMVDLQGPKLRLGRFDGPVELRNGQRFVLTTRRAEMNLERRVLPIDYPQLPQETKAGHEILLADGTVRARVESVRDHLVTCRVLEGRELLPRAGVSLPEATVVRSALTAKDRRDLAFAVKHEVDVVALSFVRRAADVELAKRLLRRLGGDQLLVAKIENRQAVDNIDEILAAADGLMVARGDLGVELPTESVPLQQKRIIRLSSEAGKPVITATQMLESMRFASRPTRAEASDVANAVLDGTWALMLSAETATGEYPIESVKMMSRIAESAEQILRRQLKRRPQRVATTVAEGIAEAAARLALDVGAEAVVALTRSGATARQVARFVLPLPVYGYTPSARTLYRMTLFRGVRPRLLAEQGSFDGAIRCVSGELVARRDVRKGQLILVIGGAPDEPLGVTNRLVVHQAL